MFDKYHIGIVGPCNPKEFQCILQMDNLPQIHSNASSVNTYIKELLLQGYCVSVFSLYDDYKKVLEFHSDKLNIYLIPRKMKNNFLSHFFPLYAGNRISKIINRHKENIDVLHAQWTYESAIAAQKFEQEKPIFCTVRDWAPFMYTQQKRTFNKIFWLIKRLILYKVMRSKKTHFIANSDYTYNLISQAYPQKDVNVIPNPIQKECFVKEKKQECLYSFISICHSIAEPRKNIITLLRAFALFKRNHADAKLCLVGEVDANSNILKAAKEENLLKSVDLVGTKTHEEVFDYIDKSYCLVHPSREETFGNILLEGIARKTLCIGGENSGAVPQVLGNGKYGLLCDVCDVNSLYQTMEKAWNKDLYAKITECAYGHVRETYSSDFIVKKTIHVYEKYLSE